MPKERGNDICNLVQELEEQRNGRNKSTTINHTYINGGEYRRKIDKISKSSDLNRIIYQLAKKMLNHRSGTVYEDMYWIDLDTFEVVAEETNSKEEKQITYSAKTKKIVSSYSRLVTIHSHPDSFPPSIGDLNSNYEHGYDTGIVVCHDGTVYMYRVKEFIPPGYYERIVAEFINQGYNENEAQLCALEDVTQKFQVEFKEVTGNDV